ncbi:AAA domain-containing protein [Aureispira anguillae]|uniref:AAA domain-containing protein n=1 Tax=Aureispira anguillae TaxID=2864201 RepID=A0A915YLE1_9BACT|nr:AAA domain-containing protein [Aureispira anguillae]BDS15263.1 AAA domain-containing protein [Aureispira anguillae]
MQTLDIRFLKNLQEKLSAGNFRSIHLNALPKRYLTRLDLADLDTLSEGTSKQFLEVLFTQAQFDFPITLGNNEQIDSQQEEKIVRRLSSMTIEHNDHHAEHGNKTFAFGYPILLVKDPNNPSKIIKAPLIIWSLEIERNFEANNEWLIRRKEDYSVVTNSVLATFLRNQANIELQPMYDQMLEDAILDKDELAEMAQLHMQQLNPNISDRTKHLFREILDKDVAPIKTEQEIQALPLDSPAILWSGIFGLFRSQKDSIIKDLDFFIQNIHQLQPLVEQNPNPSDPKRSSFMKHSFTMLETDPCQQQLLHHLSKGKNLVIQGPPGTGKSQTLTGIIANTISNAGTCLVVSEKKAALDVIYATLQKMGLEELAIIVEDVHQDRATLVNSVRERAQHQHQPYRVSPNFIRLLQSCAAHVARLQDFHKKLQQPITNDAAWTDVVGTFLDSNQKNDKGLLVGLLNAQQFEFTTTEFEDILSILPEGQSLYQQLGTFNHPLNALNDRFFHQANTMQVEADTQKALDNVCFVVQAAQRDAFSYLFEYEQLLEKHFSDVYLAKMKLIDRAIDIIEGGLAQSKYYFNKNGGFYRKLMKNVSDKYKKLEQEKVDVLESFLKVQKIHFKYAYFKYQFMDTSDHSKLEFKKLLDHLVDYKSQVYDWFEARSPFIQKLVKELGPNKIYKYVSFDQRVIEITKNLDAFERNFATSKVFKVEFKFVTKNIRKRLTQIEDLDNNLQKLKKEFDNFTAYHALKFFWLSLNKRQQIAFQGLANANPKDWSGAFSSWYLHTLLAHHENQLVPDEKAYRSSVSGFTKELKTLQEILVGHTLKYWRGKQSQAVQQFHQQKAPLTLNNLYNTRSHKGSRRSPLRKIIETSPDLLSSFFPVLMVSPAVCSAILPLHPGLFDVVIFDEASQLNLEESFSALVRGKYKIIAGDSHQLPPPDSFQSHYFSNANQQDFVIDDEYWEGTNDSVAETIDYLSNSPSLLEYALSVDAYQESFLALHYRSQHPYLIDFSNAAFYGNRLSSFPAQQAYTPIEFRAIDGVYKNYSNEQEAIAIVNYLLSLIAEATTCPSIGVATFNLHQRNLILEQLQQAAIHNSTTKAQLQQLYKAGFFVRNLENIQGEECDILILSTTFGIQENGTMATNLGPINHQDGYKLLNVIVTRARQKVCVFSSIPPSHYQTYEQEIRQHGNTGKGILYAYLAYAKAVHDQQHDSRQTILDLLYDNCLNKPIDPSLYQKKSNLFEQQVLHFLQLEFPKLNIQTNYQYAGFSLPLAVLNDQDQLCLAFYYDLHYKSTDEEAYAWDLFYEQQLQKMGIACHRIWSKEWWENKLEAQQKLTVQIRDKMG